MWVRTGSPKSRALPTSRTSARGSVRAVRSLRDGDGAGRRGARRVCGAPWRSSVSSATARSQPARAATPSNGPEFGALAEAQGVTLEIVPGAREAELSFLGTTYELRGEGQLVVDCGGGSTELVLGDVSGERCERVAKVTTAALGRCGQPPHDRALLALRPARARPSWTRRAAWATAEFRPYFERSRRASAAHDRGGGHGYLACRDQARACRVRPASGCTVTC